MQTAQGVVFRRIRLSMVVVFSQVFAIAAMVGQAPAAPGPATFEVVVIRPAQPEDTNWRMEFNPGKMRVENRSVRDLIEFAYDLKSDTQLLNASGWLSSQRFDIDGKEDEALGKTLETCPLEQRRQLMRELVRSVLQERFHLQVEAKTAQVSVLALVVAKGGAKVKVADPKDGKTFRGLVGPAGKIEARGATMQLLADRLARTPEASGRVVLDQTQMGGEYSWSLRWAPDAGLAGQAEDVDAPPPLLTALQEQLGLKLEAKKAEVPAISVVHIEQPTPN